MYEDFDKFLKYLKPKVKADGSVGLANAIQEFWKIEPKQAIKEQVTGRLHATGKYIVERGAETTSFLIRANPLYKNQLLHDIKVALITAALTLLTGYILWLIDNQSKHQEMRQIQQQLKSVSDKVDSLSKK